jgi:hypothetical protein
MSLSKRYDKLVIDYIAAFEKKHEVKFTDSVGTSIFSFNEHYFLTFDDIRYDVNQNCPKGLIFQWQDDCEKHIKEPQISFISYALGIRYEDIQFTRNTAL